MESICNLQIAYCSLSSTLQLSDNYCAVYIYSVHVHVVTSYIKVSTRRSKNDILLAYLLTECVYSRHVYSYVWLGPRSLQGVLVSLLEALERWCSQVPVKWRVVLSPPWLKYLINCLVLSLCMDGFLMSIKRPASKGVGTNA